MKRTVIMAAIMAVFMMMPLNLFGEIARTPAGASKDIALVIGNNDYAHFAKLIGAGTDASAVAEALDKIGYDVTLVLDASADAMDRAIDTFAAKLGASPGSQGFFWFSGHGIQLDHSAYLAGTDADTADEQLRARAGLVSIGRLFEAISRARNKLNVVIIDTEINPFRNAETAVFMEQALLEKLPGNICYIRSASPGEHAPDLAGPFAPSVVKNIKDLYSQVLIRRAFLRITEETSIASRDTQIPMYYIPRR